MVRYAIVNDAGLFFAGYKYSAAKYNNVPTWDSENAIIFADDNEALGCLVELGEGRIATLTITL